MPAIAHNAPPVWKNQDIVLHHGTTWPHAQKIKSTGVNPKLGRARTDFGIGFYTTTSLRQARSWAALLATASGVTGAVVTIVCTRDALAALHTLAFVRGDYDADDFWSFVWHCRSGAPDHGRGHVNTGLYDLVYGPVTAFWGQRSAMHDSDQVSFHTSAAARAIHSITIAKLP